MSADTEADDLDVHDASPEEQGFLMAEMATRASEYGAEVVELRNIVQLIQGQNWQLQDDVFGREIRKRALAALERTAKFERKTDGR